MKARSAGFLSLAVAVVAFGAAATLWPVNAAAEDKTEQVAPPQAFDKAPAVGTRAMCPVSKHQFVVSEKTKRSEHKGKHYAFCCAECMAPFDADPEKYLSSKGGGMPLHK